MNLRMRHDCWVCPSGYGLRLFRSGGVYAVSDTLAALLLQNQFAEIITTGAHMTHYPPRILTLISPPVYEPLTLAEVKLFLRVDGTEEDALILEMISSTRERLESWLRKSLLTQTWELTQRVTTLSEIALPMGPVQGITQVQVERITGSEILAETSYRFVPESQSILFTSGLDAERMRIHYVAGYEEATKIPAVIIQAILHGIAYAYHQREAASELPSEVKRMVADFREARL